MRKPDLPEGYDVIGDIHGHGDELLALLQRLGYYHDGISERNNLPAGKERSLVVQGSGKPIGYSNIEMRVSDEEKLLFEHVNRNEGDSLLGIAWIPDAPPGW